MKKILKLALLMLLLMCLVAGCSNQPNTPSDNSSSTDDTTQDDDNTEKLFEEKSIQSIGQVTVTSSGKFTLEGSYKVGDGVLVKVDSASRAVEENNGDSDDTEYYQTDNGYYLVMVEEEGTLEFDPQKMDIAEGETISIGKFNNSNDFEITTAEHKANNLHNITEEYYYVDFSTSEFSELDKSDIVIRQTGLNLAVSYSAITGNSVSDTYAPIDFSAESGFGIIQKRNESGDDNQPSYKIHVVNPIDIKTGTSVTLTDLYSVLRIDSSSFSSGKEYCIEISGLSSDIVTQIAQNDYFSETTLIDAVSGRVKGLAIPYFFSNDGKIIFYIGALTNDMMLNIDFESFYTGLESVNCTASIIEKPDYIASATSYPDITNGNVTLTAGYDSSDFITIVCKSTAENLVNITSGEDMKMCYSTLGYFYYYYNGSGGSGGAFAFPMNNCNIFAGFVGYSVIDLKGKDVKKGVTLGNVELAGEKTITPGYVYSHVSGEGMAIYASETGEYWLGNSFLIPAYHEGDAFRAGTFVCTSTESDLQGFRITDGSIGKTGKNVVNDFYNYNGTDNRCRITFAFEGENVSYNFEIDEFSYMSETDKSITGTMILLEGTTEKAKYANVSFVWQADTSN